MTLKAYDAHGGESSKEIIMEVWNDGTSSVETAFEHHYELPIVLLGFNSFSMTVTDGEAMTGQELPGYTGNYDSVAVLDYAPSTTYQASDVLSQSMSVQFAKSTGATSLWYTNGNVWQLPLKFGN